MERKAEIEEVECFGEDGGRGEGKWGKEGGTRVGARQRGIASMEARRVVAVAESK